MILLFVSATDLSKKFWEMWKANHSINSSVSLFIVREFISTWCSHLLHVAVWILKCSYLHLTLTGRFLHKRHWTALGCKLDKVIKIQKIRSMDMQISQLRTNWLSSKNQFYWIGRVHKAQRVVNKNAPSLERHHALILV